MTMPDLPDFELLLLQHPAAEAHATAAAQRQLDALIHDLEPAIGRERMIEIADAADRLAGCLRREAVARVLAALHPFVDDPDLDGFVLQTEGEDEAQRWQRLRVWQRQNGDAAPPPDGREDAP